MLWMGMSVVIHHKSVCTHAISTVGHINSHITKSVETYDQCRTLWELNFFALNVNMQYLA
jgi:hypothetical protein